MDKNKVLWNIRKLENELQSEQLLEEEITRKTVHYKTLCMDEVDILFLNYIERLFKYCNSQGHCIKVLGFSIGEYKKASRLVTCYEEIGAKIHNILWKICHADFVHSCECERRSNYLTKMERSNLFIHKYELPGKNSDMKEKLDLKDSLTEKLEELKKLNAIKIDSISKTETYLGTLKERNAGIRQELIRKVEEQESQEEKLEDLLNQIEEMEYMLRINY